MTARSLPIVPRQGRRPGQRAGARALLAAALLVVIASPAEVRGQGSALDDAELLNRADSVRIVLPDAPTLVLTEFVDFACSDCRAFHVERADSLRALVAAEGLAYVFRAYPIPRLLRGYHGAEAALCAGGIAGRSAFEAMQRVLFERQREWAGAYDPEPLLHGYARELGLGVAFDDCLRRNATWPLIAADLRQGVAMGIPGTPTFVLTRADGQGEPESFYGNQPMERFREAIARARAGD
jgi:protein-disulfide isomerase